jgi:hypothetical protein
VSKTAKISKTNHTDSFVLMGADLVICVG